MQLNYQAPNRHKPKCTLLSITHSQTTPFILTHTNSLTSTHAHTKIHSQTPAHHNRGKSLNSKSRYCHCRTNHQAHFTKPIDREMHQVVPGYRIRTIKLQLETWDPRQQKAKMAQTTSPYITIAFHSLAPQTPYCYISKVNQSTSPYNNNRKFTCANYPHC